MLQPARQGVYPLFAYLTVGIFALVVGGAIVGWIMSGSNASFPINNSNLTTNTTETDNKQNIKPVENSAPNKNNSIIERTESTPIPQDTSAIENEVKTALEGWTQTLVNRDFDGHMQYYADRLDVYYKNKNVDYSFVRNKNLKLFEKYSTFGLNISNIKTDADSQNGQVIATADFTFDFRGKNASHASISKTEFRLKKINGVWKITSEKDLQDRILKKSESSILI